MTNEQPDALRLADALENLEATGLGGDCFMLTDWSEKQATLAAAELRRLHAENQALRADAERMLISDGAILAAARTLNKRHADECNVDEVDCWKTYGDSFKDDAHAMLQAAIAAIDQARGKQ